MAPARCTQPALSTRRRMRCSAPPSHLPAHEKKTCINVQAVSAPLAFCLRCSSTRVQNHSDSVVCTLISRSSSCGAAGTLDFPRFGCTKKPTSPRAACSRGFKSEQISWEDLKRSPPMSLRCRWLRARGAEVLPLRRGIGCFSIKRPPTGRSE